MKSFHTYREPPTPGMFATDESFDVTGVPIRIGDIVRGQGDERGMVVGIFGHRVVYLVDEHCLCARLNDFETAECKAVRIIGHAYDALREIARIEALAG